MASSMGMSDKPGKKYIEAAVSGINTMQNWDNKAIAEKLQEIADLLEQQKANPFRVNAYRREAECMKPHTSMRLE